jgi:hypothetical protein
MLPIPFDNYIPKAFKRDSKTLALSSKVDANLNAWMQDLIGYDAMLDPVRIPSVFLNELGYLLNAGILDYDTETQKRKKIATAVQGHKRRGSWTFDAKPKIDIIAGGNSQIFTDPFGDDWILVGEWTDIDPAYTYWASLGVDGVDDDLGIALIGSGLEIEVAGNVYIDVDNPALTAAEQQQIIDQMADIVPAYCYAHFGYLAAGIFVEYFVIG